eukprot:scaffold126894_cov22-Tisochrysis_lutea.AAC.1
MVSGLKLSARQSGSRRTSKNPMKSTRLRIGNSLSAWIQFAGVLLRRLQTDPELSGVGAILFDEFHERNLDADCALALCLDLQGVKACYITHTCAKGNRAPRPTLGSDECNIGRRFGRSLGLTDGCTTGGGRKHNGSKQWSALHQQPRPQLSGENYLPWDRNLIDAGMTSVSGKLISLLEC